MFDHVAYEFNDEQTNGHPHDLLARLYREIGISAVAAALEASKPLNELSLIHISEPTRPY